MADDSQSTPKDSPVKPSAGVRRARFPRAKPNLLEAGRRIGPSTLPATNSKPSGSNDADVKVSPITRRATRLQQQAPKPLPSVNVKDESCAAIEADRTSEALELPPVSPTPPAGTSVIISPVQPVVLAVPSSPKTSPTVPETITSPSSNPELDTPLASLLSPTKSCSAAAPLPSTPIPCTSPQSTPMQPPLSPLLIASAKQPSNVPATKDAGQPSSIAKQLKPKSLVRGVRKLETSTPRRIKKGQGPPEKGKMTMFDLIYWNPPKNPMTYEDDDVQIALPKQSEKTGTSANEERLTEERIDDPDAIDDANQNIGAVNDMEDEYMPTPQLKIGPDGSIVLDEKSLVIEATRSKNDISSSPAVFEQSSYTTYASYRKKKPAQYWSDRETARFYVALSTVGTDFSMMLNLFPKRTRHELKCKFKKEDRTNKSLVDRAISDHQQYNLSIFDDEEDLDIELEEARQVKKAKADCKSRGRKQPGKNMNGTKKPPIKKRPHALQDETDTESEHDLVIDESKDASPASQDRMRLSSIVSEEDKIEIPLTAAETGTTSNADTVDEQSDEESADTDSAVFASLLKPTRSGRQPKKNSLYSADLEMAKPVRKRAKLTQNVSSEQLQIGDDVNCTGTKECGKNMVILATNSGVGGSQMSNIVAVSPKTPTHGFSPIRTPHPIVITSPPTPEHSYSISSLSQMDAVAETIRLL